MSVHQKYTSDVATTITRSDEIRRLLSLTTIVLVAIFLPYYLATLDRGWPIARDGTGLAVGRDFLNFWMYGRAALAPDPSRYYDLPTYWKAIETVAGRDYPGQQWSYPPSILLFATPFGTLPYLAALAIWTVLGIVVFVAALRLWTRDPMVIGICTLAPAGLFGLMSGQLAYLCAAGMLTVLRWRVARPIAAGIILGLLTVKPQLGVLFPVLLTATRNWRVIGVAATTGVLMVGLTAAIWGTEIWREYLVHGLHNQAGVLTDGSLIVAPFMPTVFMNLRVAGASLGLANTVQAVFAIAAIVLVAAAFRRKPAPDDRGAMALFLAAGAIATPYLMAYDLLAVSTAAVLLAVQIGKPRMLALLVFLFPLIQMAGANAGLPGAALIPVLFALWLWRTDSRRADDRGFARVGLLS